jgi:hypothetical protein
MANIKKPDADKKSGRYIILPRNQETYEEKFAFANGKKLPFETPVTLDQNDVRTLENQKEPFKTDSQMTVFDIMDKYQVPQEKAVAILKAQAEHPELGTQTIKWRSKYLVQAV